MAHRFYSCLTSLLRHNRCTTTSFIAIPAKHASPSLIPYSSRFLSTSGCSTTSFSTLYYQLSTIPKFHPSPSPNPFSIRFLSTSRTHRAARPDIGARARQLQTRRLWTYALTFSCIAGFIVIVLNQFQDQLVFYVTPTDALAQYSSNPSKSKFRLGGLVLDGSVTQIPSSPEMEFVITDLITDMLVKYEGSLPDLFREGHSVVVEGFIKPFPEEMKKKEESLLGKRNLEVSHKARSGDCFFSATEVLAKHDEKYMPKEVADALEKNKKILQQEEEEKVAAAAGTSAVGTA